jgi:hypothetical protein
MHSGGMGACRLRMKFYLKDPHGDKTSYHVLCLHETAARVLFHHSDAIVMEYLILVIVHIAR